MFHAPFIQMAEGLRLHAVCSRTDVRRREAERDYPEVVTYATLDDMLGDPNVDMVVLVTPHDTHAPMAVQAMDLGKHVVTDKVMCMDEAEGRSMIEASTRNGVLFSVYQNRRWDGDFLTLKEILSEGRLGELYSIDSRVDRLSGPSYGWRAWKRHGGGRTRDWGAHLIDQMLQLFGPVVRRVYAQYEYRFPEDESDVESDSIVLMELEGGISFRIELSNQAFTPRPRFEAVGSEGSFRKHGTDPQEEVAKEGRAGSPVVEDPARYELKRRGSKGVEEVALTPMLGRWQTFYENIGQVLAGKEKLAVKPEESLEGVRVLDAIRASADKHIAVELSPK